MKTNKFNVLVLMAIAAVFFSSCSVTYRTRHPRYNHHYGYVEPMNNKIQTVSAVTVISQQPSSPVNSVNTLSINK